MFPFSETGWAVLIWHCHVFCFVHTNELTRQSGKVLNPHKQIQFQFQSAAAHTGTRERCLPRPGKGARAGGQSQTRLEPLGQRWQRSDDHVRGRGTRRGNIVNWRSHAGIVILLLNVALTTWHSERQGTAEAFGSDFFVAL